MSRRPRRIFRSGLRELTSGPSVDMNRPGSPDYAEKAPAVLPRDRAGDEAGGHRCADRCARSGSGTRGARGRTTRRFPCHACRNARTDACRSCDRTKLEGRLWPLERGLVRWRPKLTPANRYALPSTRSAATASTILPTPAAGGSRSMPAPAQAARSGRSGAGLGHPPEQVTGLQNDTVGAAFLEKRRSPGITVPNNRSLSRKAVSRCHEVTMYKKPPVPVPPGYRFCFLCESLLPLEAYGLRKGTRDGRQSNCRACVRASSKRSRIRQKHLRESIGRIDTITASAAPLPLPNSEDGHEQV